MPTGKANATDLRKIYRWFFGFSSPDKGNRVRSELKGHADTSLKSLSGYLKSNVPRLSAGFTLSQRQYTGLRRALNDLDFDPLDPYPKGHNCW